MKLQVKNRYGIAPNELLNNKNISLKSKGLFVFMQSKPDDWEFSIKKIAFQSKEGIDAVRMGILELENTGYLKRKKYKDEKGYWKIDYILYDKPILESPILENPILENTLNNSKKDISKKDISKKDNNSLIQNSKNFDDRDIELTELLYKLIKNNYPFVKEKTKPQKEKDYKEMRRLKEIDKYKPEQIEFIIKWSQQDDFWKQNIRSVSKLRKQFETLLVKAKGQFDKNRIINFD